MLNFVMLDSDFTSYRLILYGRLASLCLASEHATITQCVEKKTGDRQSETGQDGERE